MSRYPTRATFIAGPLPIEADLRLIFADDPPSTIFDIGSCEGEDAIRYARLFPTADVYAFEPLPENVAIAQANIAQFAPEARITLVPVALADRDGTAEFHVSSGHPEDRPRTADWNYGNKSSSLLPPERHLDVFDWVRFERVTTVTTERLDHFCARSGISKVELVHIDVQGAELAVLRGAGTLLARTRAVWMEVEAVPLYRGQPLKPEVEAFMTERGFRIAKDTVGAISGDQLYVRG
jgi:FkbM family methyltransferase